MIYFDFIDTKNIHDDREKPDSLTDEQRDRLLSHYPTLALEYDALCHTLMRLLSEPPSDLHADPLSIPPEAKLSSYQDILCHTVDQAILFNKLLYQTYHYTQLHAADQAQLSLQKTKLDLLQAKLNPAANQLRKPTPKSEALTMVRPDSFMRRALTFFKSWLLHLDHLVRKKTLLFNPGRFFLSRLRRFFLNLRAVLASHPELLSAFNQHYQSYERIFGPLLNILSWLFILPRLLTNLLSTGWHVIQHDNLTEAEKKLSGVQRLKNQLRDRKFELANDLVWVPGSLLTCFFLVGSLATIGAALTVAMFTWDVLIASRRAYEDLSRLSLLIRQHEYYCQSLMSPLAKQIHQIFIDYLKQLSCHEKKRHALSLANVTLITICTFFVLSCVTLPVVVPLIAAIVLIIVTLCNIMIGRHLTSIRPANHLLSLSPDSYEGLATRLQATLKRQDSALEYIDLDSARSSRGTSVDLVSLPRTASNNLSGVLSRDCLVPPASPISTSSTPGIPYQIEQISIRSVCAH